MFSRWFGGGKKRDAELHAAAQAGDLAGVRLALDKGANINALDREYQETVLHVAVDRENKELVQLLLSKGANPNIISGQHYTPLIIAVSKGDAALPLVELLLAGRADPALAPRSGPNEGAGPLHIAAYVGANAIFRHLLAFGAKPHVLPKGSNLIHMAGIGGNAETVAICLGAGATVDEVDHDGATPLHYAAIRGNAAALTALLDKGADIERRSKEDATPLLHAALQNHPTIIKLLLVRGANPDVIAVNGESVISPLLGAALAGSDEVVQLLLDAGVSPEKQVGDNFPIVAMATQAGKASTVRLLNAAIEKRHAAPVEKVQRQLKDKPRASDEGNDRQEVAAIRAMSLIEFGETFYRNVRFRNAITAYAAHNKLPFGSIGEYLDAGEIGQRALFKVQNLGVTSINGLNEAIREAMQNPPAPPTLLVEPLATKRLDLVEQIESLYPGVFAPLLVEYAATPDTDRVACSRLEAEMQRLLDDKRLAEVAIRRFNGETLAEIGESLGVSGERARQIEAQAKPWVADSAEESDNPSEGTDKITPDGIRKAWFDKYLRLKAYYEREGNAEVPYQWPEDPQLGTWVANQRQKNKKGELLPEQINLLEALGFSWSLRERGTWEDRFNELAEFKQRHGHFDVPTDYPEAPKLKPFISSTRHLFKEGSLESERIELLKEIGFNFDTGSRRRGDASPPSTLNELPAGFTLEGRTIAITGRLEQYTRDEATRLARNQGANVLDKFSGKVELLVVGSDAASKLDAALQRGIPVIDENHFTKMILAEGADCRGPFENDSVSKTVTIERGATSSKHAARSHFLDRGLLDDLNTFGELEARISELSTNKERGDAFEVFAEAYLATQAIALAQEVWPFEAIPFDQRKALALDTGRDMGVDGTYLGRVRNFV